VVEIAYAGEIDLIHLTQLFFFSTNILLEDTPEYHAARILLPAMRDANLARPPFEAENLLELFHAYRDLRQGVASGDEQFLHRRAASAYKNLFGRPVPVLKPRPSQASPA